jgi:SpoVK/Ycf46/Vps4 family AAA+-type ATPase
VLFAGPSGTGKTLTAEVLACDLGVDLYLADISQIVEKYVGETEKRLDALFDAREASGAILLFDEADAMWNYGSGLGAETSMAAFRKDIIFRSTTRPARWSSRTRSTAAGSRSTKRCRTSMRT